MNVDQSMNLYTVECIPEVNCVCALVAVGWIEVAVRMEIVSYSKSPKSEEQVCQSRDWPCWK